MSRRRRHPGFTLIELLVAIVIIATLVGTMTGFVLDVLRTRDALERISERERAVGVLLDTLERDLPTVVATGPDGGSGVAGDSSGLRLAVATTPVRLGVPAPGTRALGTIDWLDVRFDPAARTVRLRRIAANPAPATAIGTEAPPPIRARDPNALGGDLHLVAFRYHDGRGWRDSFDSRSGGLPVAIEVSVWFDPWPGAVPVEEDDAPGVAEFAGAGDFAAAIDAADVDDGTTAAADVDRPRPDRRRILAVPGARAGEVAAATTESPASEAAP